MSKFFLALIFLILGSGCAAQQSPTPIIIVVTATPAPAQNMTIAPSPAASSPNDAAAPTTSPATPIPVTVAPSDSGSSTTSKFPTKPTEVQYVRAKQDINIRQGPGTQYDIVGGVYAGQTARVTGFMNAEGTWWRVICPDGKVSECWVSADTALTETASAPNASPTSDTASPTLSAQVGTETYTRALAAALQGKNFDALKSMMGDPFTIGYWLSEGKQTARDEAWNTMKTWIAPANEIIIDIAGKTDQTALLNGTNPLGMWNPNVKVVNSVYVKGLGETGKDEALLIIAQRDDKSLYWYGMLYAGNGGFKK